MDDDAFDPNDPGNIEVERRLEAYADARLSPGATATTRMRTAVMQVAHRQAAFAQADASARLAETASGAGAGGRTAGIRRAWRHPFALVLAACLVVGIVASSVFGSAAGGPLYATRLSIEEANLPADLVARARAEVDRLDARLAEAQHASIAGDAPATTAAFNAYTTIVVEASAGTAGDKPASAVIVVGLTRQVVVLTAMTGSVPAASRAAAQQALASSATVLADLKGS